MKPAHIVGQTLTRARNAIADRKRAPAQGVMIAPHPTALKNIISILARVTFSNSEGKPNKRGNDKAGKSLFYIQEVPDMSLERAISPAGSALSSFAR